MTSGSSPSLTVVDTHDQHSKLMVQLRGIFNEQHLDDLRQRTMRGLFGQKQRGFSLAESTFGYRSFPVGALRYDKAGRARPEGHKMRIDDDEALVVLRIFELYADGSSVSAIARVLNRGGRSGSVPFQQGVVDRFRHPDSGPGEVHRPLGLEPHRQAPRSPFREGPFLPEAAVGVVRFRRRIATDCSAGLVGACPGSPRSSSAASGRAARARRGFSAKQGGRVRAFPAYLLSGAMFCGECGRSIALVSGKRDGYYGCTAARTEGCGNRVRVPRLLAEKIIVGAVQQRLADPSAIQYVFHRLREGGCRSVLGRPGHPAPDEGSVGQRASATGQPRQLRRGRSGQRRGPRPSGADGAEGVVPRASDSGVDP